MRLDLGSGQSPKKDHIGVDIVDGPNVGIVADLFSAPHWDIRKILGHKPAPEGVDGKVVRHWDEGYILYPDTVDVLHSSHLVEHVPDLVAFMHEAYRVLKPGGRFTIAHPYQHSNRAWQDPTHVRALNEVSWSYYDADWRKSIGIDHYDGFTCDFQVVEIVKVLAPGIEKEFNFNRRKLDEAMRHQVNIIDDLHVTLRSRKADG